MTATTVELTRETFHCPLWCVVPLDEHQRDLRGWEGFAVHTSEETQIPGAGDLLSVGSNNDLAGRMDEAPIVVIDPDRMLTPQQARHYAAELIRHAEMIERLGNA